MGPETTNDYPGEGGQQLIGLGWTGPQLPELWDSKILLWFLPDSEPRITVLVRASSNLPDQPERDTLTFGEADFKDNPETHWGKELVKLKSVWLSSTSQYGTSMDEADRSRHS
jgi:hypothetical protein